MIKRIKKNKSVFLQEVRVYREGKKIKQESIRYIGKEKLLSDVKINDMFFHVDNDKFYNCFKVEANSIKCLVYSIAGKKAYQEMLLKDSKDHFYEGSVDIAKNYIKEILENENRD